MPSTKSTQEILNTTTTLKRVAAELNKLLGGETIGDIAIWGGSEISRLPLGIAKLDEALGGGLPMGRMVEFYGERSSCKTLVSLLAIKAAQALGHECVYIDAEKTFDPKWAKAWGIDTDKLLVVPLNITEEVFDVSAKLLGAKPGVLVIDSIAVLAPKKEIEDNTETQNIALNARQISKGLKKLIVHNSETLIIFINQLRTNLTAMGAFGFKSTGGLALEHADSIKIHFKKDKEWIYEGTKKPENIVGQTTLYRIDKNKTAQPEKVGSFKLLYSEPKIEE